MHSSHPVSHVIYVTTSQNGEESTLYQIAEDPQHQQQHHSFSHHSSTCIQSVEEAELAEILDHQNNSNSRQVPSVFVHVGERIKNVCTNNLTCICLILIPVTIAGMLICVFVMQDSNINAKDNLHTRVIYAFIIFSVTFLSPFALFFVIVVINKLYYNYFSPRRCEDQDHHQHQHHQHLNEQQRDQEAQEYSGLFNPLNNETLVGLSHGHQNRVLQSVSPFRVTTNQLGGRGRPRLRRQDAIDDCPPDYEDLMSGSALGLMKDDPPSYEMALLYPTVVRTSSEKSPEKQGPNSENTGNNTTDNTPPPAYKDFILLTKNNAP